MSYKFNKVLPALDLDKNYYLPGNFEFINALKNLGFEKIQIEYPYLSTPYKNLVMDHTKFLINLFLRTKFKHAFWGNMMNIAAQKR